MRRRFIHLLFALPIVFSVGCSNDELTDPDPTAPGSDSNIRFEIGFAPQTRVATDAAFTSAWEHGDAIGLFAVPHGDALAASGNYIHNVKLTYKETTPGDPATGTWGLDDAAELLWPRDGGRLDFYAYYPYTDNAGNPKDLDPTAIAFSVMTDQSATTDGKSNYALSDLLIAKADNSCSGYGKGSTVALSFIHTLAMVQVEFDLTECYVEPGAIVQLMGCTTDAQLNLNNAGASAVTTLTTSTATPIRMYRVEKPGDGNYQSSYTCRALVPVQNVATGTVLFQTRSGNTDFYSEPLQSDLQLTAEVAEVFGQVVEVEDYLSFITDDSFKWYCRSSFDKNGDGKLSRKEVLAVTGIRVNSLWISSLEGIKHFRNLTSLSCYNNSLSSLDVSALTNLTTLNCFWNSLSSLDVSALTNLTELYCSGNTLSSLDVSALTNLTSLDCSGNPLSSLDVSALTNLTSLSCSNNSLSSLDVSALTNLTYLNCSSNTLSSLDVSALTNLTTLYCSGNTLTSLDVSALTNLTSLDCYNNSLSSLDVSALTNLTYLDCSSNTLSSLDVSGNDVLRELRCGDGTGITPLTVWVNPGKELATIYTVGKLLVHSIEIEGSSISPHPILTKDAAPLFGVTVTNKP